MLAAADLSTARLLRKAFDSVGYNAAALARGLGLESGMLPQPVDQPLYVKRLSQPGPLNSLIKFFFLGVSLPTGELDDVLAPANLEDVAALGLIAADGETARPLLRITGFDNLLFAHDFYTPQSMKRPDLVLGVSPASVTLVSLTVRRWAERALDLGTGCGIQALVASRHCGHVVVTDTNQRALEVARLNAALNGIDNVEFRHGGLFEPVQGERFDLIVSNPPFVISPDSAYEYRDSGLPGDTICRLVVRQAADHLTEGGFATFLCNWANTGASSALDSTRAWLEGAPVDAWVMHDPPIDPLTYAGRWIGSPNAAAYTADLDRWTNYYEREGITSLTFGSVILRRRSSATNWSRADELPDTRRRICGPHIERIFAAQDYIESTPDEEFMAEALVLMPDVRLEQVTSRQGDTMAFEKGSLVFAEGLPFEAALNLHSLQMVTRMDGKRTLQSIAEEIASVTGASPAEVRKGVMDVAKLMVGLGFLAPARENGAGYSHRKEARE